MYRYIIYRPSISKEVGPVALYATHTHEAPVKRTTHFFCQVQYCAIPRHIDECVNGATRYQRDPATSSVLWGSARGRKTHICIMSSKFHVQPVS